MGAIKLKKGVAQKWDFFTEFGLKLFFGVSEDPILQLGGGIGLLEFSSRSKALFAKMPWIIAACEK